MYEIYQLWIQHGVHEIQIAEGRAYPSVFVLQIKEPLSTTIEVYNKNAMLLTWIMHGTHLL